MIGRGWGCCLVPGIDLDSLFGPGEAMLFPHLIWMGEDLEAHPNDPVTDLASVFPSWSTGKIPSLPAEEWADKGMQTKFPANTSSQMSKSG